MKVGFYLTNRARWTGVEVRKSRLVLALYGYTFILSWAGFKNRVDVRWGW